MTDLGASEPYSPATPTEAKLAMLRLIVVPLDGSSFGEQPLPLAIRIAERQRAELELVHVYEMIMPYSAQGAPPFDPTLDADLRRDRRSYLESVAQWVRRNTSAKVTATILSGDDVAGALAEHLAERRADLAVMATHGRGGLSRIWVGSVANDLVRSSDTPVLLVRPTESGTRETKSQPFRHALLPLDGTVADEEAIEDAMAVAGDAGVEFLLMHVVVPVVYLAEPVETALLTETAIESAMAQYLEEVASRIRSRGFTVSTRVVVDPSPVHAILELANERGADLIAMETHARTGVSRLLLGSVTDKVIRAARVPVLVHRRRAVAERSAAESSSASATSTESRRF
jgi:nucleotide-binding universal stress UspA family protein